jgi:hypothetical protein
MLGEVVQYVVLGDEVLGYGDVEQVVFHPRYPFM